MLYVNEYLPLKNTNKHTKLPLIFTWELFWIMQTIIKSMKYAKNVQSHYVNAVIITIQ